MTNYVRPKKHLGQHFLKDLNIASKIAESMKAENIDSVVEVGAGTGVLTQFLLKNDKFKTYIIEIDVESVEYLNRHFPEVKDRLFFDDFLKFNLKDLNKEKIGLIGNFPYNISSQIFFKALENKEMITEIVCMIQKEVAERIASPAGKKAYGILSVLLQAYYNIEYLFTVDEHVFNPPPKVKSSVIRLTRNEVKELDCNEKLFRTIIKTGFNQRRKTLRNSLKSLTGSAVIDDEIMSLRPEQLPVDRFIYLTNLIEKHIKDSSLINVIDSNTSISEEE